MSPPLSAPHPFLFTNDHPSPHHSHLDYGLKVGFEGSTYAVIKSVECACFELLRQRPPLTGVLIGLNGDVRCAVIEVEVNTYLDRVERPSVKIEGEIQYIDNLEAINRWLWHTLPSAEHSKGRSPAPITLVDETRLKAYIAKYTKPQSIGRPPQRPSIELALRRLSLSLNVSGGQERASSLVERRSKWGWLIALIATSLLAFGSWLWSPILISLMDEPSSASPSKQLEEGRAIDPPPSVEAALAVNDLGAVDLECLAMMPPTHNFTVQSRRRALERLEDLMIKTSTQMILMDGLRTFLDGWKALEKTLQCELDNRCASHCQRLCEVELKVTSDLSTLLDSEVDPILLQVLREGERVIHALRGQVRCSP